MSSHADLLNHIFFISIYSTALGACYQMVIEPGEFLSFLPRHFFNRKASGFATKVSSCGKCVAGWIALITTPVWFIGQVVFLYDIAFIMLVSVAISIVFTGIINVYVQNRS